jgi:anaerobic magnesium-protoporphyrin IX monomethyl ester cyclase
MADILLTHCNHLYSDRKQVRKMQPYPPLQTMMAAALLRQEGLDVALIDTTLTSPGEAFRSALRTHRPRLVAICDDSFNFLAKMCLERNRQLALSMAGMAREQGVPVLISSPDSADHPAGYLDQGMDFVVLGEVESTLLHAAQCLLGAEDRGSLRVAGLAFRDAVTGEVRLDPPADTPRDLSTLPMAAWDLIDMAAYRRIWTDAHGFFSLNLVSSRGCPYSCNWCAKPIYGQTYRYYPPERVAGEMRYLKSEFAPDHLWFADDIFSLSGSWTEQFSEAVVKLGAQIPFKMQSRCDLMTPTTVAALKRAGCSEVWMGAESGSQRILDAMDKGIRVDEIYKAREDLKRHGIRASFFLQFGYPGESWQDIQSTIRMVRETAPDEIGVSVSYPLPGTKLYARVATELGAKQNWLDSDDMAMMFRGTFATEFYAALHDALHLEVDLRNRGEDPAALHRLQDLWLRVEELGRTGAIVAG